MSSMYTAAVIFLSSDYLVFFVQHQEVCLITRIYHYRLLLLNFYFFGFYAYFIIMLLLPLFLLLLTTFYRGYRSRMENKETRLFCLRVMVGVIILFDHVDPIGAFQKKSAIDVSIATAGSQLLYILYMYLTSVVWCGAIAVLCRVY